MRFYQMRGEISMVVAKKEQLAAQKKSFSEYIRQPKIIFNEILIKSHFAKSINFYSYFRES